MFWCHYIWRLEITQTTIGVVRFGRFLNTTIKRHMGQKLGSRPCIMDLSLYLNLHNRKIIRMTRNYVDDGINAVLLEFELITEATFNRFECNGRKYGKFGFFGTNIQKIEQGGFLLNQEYYWKCLSIISTTASMETSRCAQALPARTTHSGPKYAYFVNKSAQVMVKTLNADHIKDLNKGIKRVLNNSRWGLLYNPLDLNLQMRAYMNAFLATNDDHTSQIGYLILHRDNSNKWHKLD